MNWRTEHVAAKDAGQIDAFDTTGQSPGFRTEEMWLAAALLADGFAPGAIEGPHGRKSFVFPESAREPAARFQANRFYREFFEAARAIRTLVHRGVRS